MSLDCPEFLVESDWLEENINHPDLRIVDCHYYLEIKSVGDVKLTSGLETWEESHIPGSVYIDLLTELSDRSNEIPFMMPSSEQFAETMTQYGIGNDNKVVIYDRKDSTWAARFWWMLRYNGFDNAVLLNGGWKKWQEEKRPVTKKGITPSPASFKSSLRPDLVADKEQVLHSINDTVIRICALKKEGFCQGHIPNSLNIDARELIDPELKTFLPRRDLEALFLKEGVSKTDRIIPYCSGGIASALCAFTLTMLDYEHVALYDGSLEEWRRDPQLPMEISDN